MWRLAVKREDVREVSDHHRIRLYRPRPARAQDCFKAMGFLCHQDRETLLPPRLDKSKSDHHAGARAKAVGRERTTDSLCPPAGQEAGWSCQTGRG
jgi:hypothetical protein